MLHTRCSCGQASSSVGVDALAAGGEDAHLALQPGDQLALASRPRRSGCPRRRSAARRRSTTSGKMARATRTRGRVGHAAQFRCERCARMRRACSDRMRMPADQRQHHEEADHVGHARRASRPQPGDRPTAPRGTCSTARRRPTSRTRSSSRRSRRRRRGSPSRSRPADRQRGQRDVVEHRRHEAEAERGLPRRRAAGARPASSTRTSTSDSRNTRALAARPAAGSSAGWRSGAASSDAPPTPRRRGTESVGQRVEARG